MPSITAAELIDRASAAADMHDNFVTPPQWFYWLNKYNLQLAILIARSGWVENLSTFNITPNGTEAGVFPLSIGSVPLAVVGVWEVGTQGVRLLKHNSTVEFLRQIPGSTVNPFGHSKEFRASWNQSLDRMEFNFFPEPALGTSYQVAYIPAPAKLVYTDTSAAVTYPLGWEEYIVLGMALEALDKEESDTSRIEKKLKKQSDVVEEFCWARVMSAVPTIRNSDQDERGWADKMIYPPPLQYWWI